MSRRQESACERLDTMTPVESSGTRSLERVVWNLNSPGSDDSDTTRGRGSDDARVTYNRSAHMLRTAAQELAENLDKDLLTERFRATIESKESVIRRCEEVIHDLRRAVETLKADGTGKADSNQAGDDICLDCEELEDVVVAWRDEAEALNENIIGRIQRETPTADSSTVEVFMTLARKYRNRQLHHEDFYVSLVNLFGASFVLDLVPDLARLIPERDLRLHLLRAHQRWVGEEGERAEMEPLPLEVDVQPINHVLFVIHGIGEHADFSDHQLRYDGSAGFEGGNFSLRLIIDRLIRSHFSEIQLKLEVVSVEWHEELHVPTGVDEVYDLITVEGASSLRDLNKTTFMDVLYYLSTTYGQRIVSSVTRQLNEQYQVFMKMHPGYKGGFSLFSHSLGSTISYDILTQPAGATSKNGVFYPGLDFSVDNFFAVGSPISIILLSRGDLSFKKGQFEPGIKHPQARRFYNIFHPIDPIAYRLEPLLEPEMKRIPPVVLPTSRKCKGMSLVQQLSLLDDMCASTLGSERLDFNMRPKTKEGIMEIAYAISAHSSYWESEDVAFFVLLKLLHPLWERLAPYKERNLPMPRLLTSVPELSLQTEILGAGAAVVRNSVTHLWSERLIILSRQALYVVHDFSRFRRRKRDEISLRGLSASLSDENPCCVQLHRGGTLIEEFKAQSKLEAHGWVVKLQDVIQAANQVSLHTKKYDGTSRSRRTGSRAHETSSHLSARASSDRAVRNLSSAENLDSVEMDGRATTALATNNLEYFGCMYSGPLLRRPKKELKWISDSLQWKSRYLTLHKDCLRVFDVMPTISGFSGNMSVIVHQSTLLLHVVGMEGMGEIIRVHDKRALLEWANIFGELASCRVIHESDVASPGGTPLPVRSPNFQRHGDSPRTFGRWNSESTLATQPSDQQISSSAISERRPGMVVSVQGHKVLRDRQGSPFVAFIIQATWPSGGTSVVFRRFNELKVLHQELRVHQYFEHHPPLPRTRLWGKFDPDYLRQKAAHIQVYLQQLADRTERSSPAFPILKQFLTLEDKGEANQIYG